MAISNPLPFVSIIVPAYNASRTIRMCIEALLSQSYDRNRYEVIIVDNVSTDKTPEIIKEYPVTYILEDKVHTSYGARNAGIRSAKGEIIFLTDSDCIPEKNWVSAGITTFSDQKIGGVTGPTIDYQPENKLEKYIAEAKPLDCSPSFRPGKMPQAFTCNVAYRKKIFDTVGLFDASMPGGGDVHMSWQMQLKTDYNLVYNPHMIVSHKHRSTYKSVFKQQMRIGYGWIDVYIRYTDHINKEPQKFLFLPPHHLRIKSLFKEIGTILWAPIGLLQTIILGKDNTPLFYWTVRYAGRRIGRIKGCRHYKTWHLWNW